MKSVILFLFAILICKTNYSQNGIKDWDINYKLIDVIKLLDYEEEYAKKVESDKEEAQYYVAMESHRFIAEFTGRKRELKDEILTSMKHVLKIKTGNPEVLNNLVSKELEFKIDSTTIWIGIQNQLIDPFFQEEKKYYSTHYLQMNTCLREAT